MTWKIPSAQRLMQVVDTTWPAAQYLESGPFTLRRGADGGKRVSSASLGGADASIAEIETAADTMRGLGQPPLFLIRDGETALDRNLHEMGYRSFDHVTLYAAPIDRISAFEAKGMAAIFAPEPMAIMAEIWAEGGICAGRLDVMRRVTGLKSCILGRHNESPDAAAFIALDGDIAMVHAIETRPTSRRQGLAAKIMGASAGWAQDNGAKTLALVVVSENQPANGLYQKLGMVKAGTYHYRIKETL